LLDVIGVLSCVRYENLTSNGGGFDTVVRFCLVDDRFVL
jgi:hypothetical protein